MTPTLLVLEDELTRLTLAPDIGASIVNWRAHHNQQPLLRHSDAEALGACSPRRLACYPLAPWSNRIAQGGFVGPDGWFALAANSASDALPIHGSAWQQPWQVIAHSSTEASLQLDSQVPFAYRAVQHVRLLDGRLELEMQVTHLDPRAAWHGLGWHPYFSRNAHTQLRVEAQHLWQRDSQQLSTHMVDVPANWNFAEARYLPDILIDNAFSGWDGNFQIIQADAGYQLDCRTHSTDHFIIFCPLQKDFFCFEPVTHPINAHHLPGRPGLRLLGYGEATRLQLSLHYQTLSDKSATS
ncbi:aldose 1-epimerase [Pseudomonas borbori]